MDITLSQSGSSVLSVAGYFIPASRCHLLLAAACHCLLSWRTSGFCLAPVGMRKHSAVLAFPRCTEKCNSECIKRGGLWRKNCLCQINMEIQGELRWLVTLTFLQSIITKSNFFFSK